MLSYLITSRVRRDLLSVLFLNSQQSFYLRELSRRIGTQVNAVSRELVALEEGGLVLSECRGNSKFYSVISSNPVFTELKGLVMKTQGLIGELSRVLKDEEILFAFVYGSFAQGTEQANSDVDLMVVGEPNMAALAGKMRVLEKKLGREINYVVYPQKEFLEKRRQGF